MPVYLVFATYDFDDGMPSLKLEDDLDPKYTIEKWFVKE